MAKYQVTAPEKVTTKIAGVTLVDGVATVDGREHRQALAYFRRHGYAVEPVGAPMKQDGDGSPSLAEPPAGNASQEAWVDWVLANVEGVDEAEVRALKRDELRDRYGRPE